jgi:hypothetical protein
MPLRTELSLRLATSLSKSADFAAAVQPITYSVSEIWENGTGTDQADLMWSDQVTIAASGTLDLDLNGGLTDALGVAANFAGVKTLLIVAAAGNTNDVIVGAAPSNAFATPFGAATHTVRVRPGGMMLLEHDGTGFAVTAGTGDILRLANGGGTTAVAFDIFIIGRSA